MGWLAGGLLIVDVVLRSKLPQSAKRAWASSGSLGSEARKGRDHLSAHDRRCSATQQPTLET
jgi:hypothetical protein